MGFTVDARLFLRSCAWSPVDSGGGARETWGESQAVY